MVGTYLLFKLYKYPFYYFLSKLKSLRFSTSMQIADLTKQFTIAVVDLFSMRGYCTLRMSAKLAYPYSHVIAVTSVDCQHALDVHVLGVAGCPVIEYRRCGNSEEFCCSVLWMSLSGSVARFVFCIYGTDQKIGLKKRDFRFLPGTEAFTVHTYLFTMKIVQGG